MMKMNKQTAVALTALASSLFSACDAGGGLQEFPQADGMPLSFLTTVEEPQTRAELTTANLTTAGVFAYMTSGSFNTSTATPGYMYNQKLERANNTSPWTYSPVKYWPNNDADKLSFFAYAPYVDESAPGGSNPALSGKTDAGYPTLTYTVATAEADQTDLLASEPLMNRTYQTSGGTANGSISLPMKHALTRVKFSVKTEMGIKITSLTVNNVPATAKLTFTSGGFSWGSYTGTKNYTATLAGGGTSVTANASSTDAAPTVATFFLLPDKTAATFSITYLQDGETIAVSRTNIAFPTASAWVQGGSVNYQLDIKRDGLSVTFTQSDEWTDSGNEALNSKEVAPGYKATDVKICDYYYSDGTTSDGGYRKYTDNTVAQREVMPVLTDKDGNARTVVGIVFYAGKHATDTDDYSSTGVGTSGFHGYAVALKDVGKLAWENKDGTYNVAVGTSTNADDWRGFYNQQRIEAYVAANSGSGWQMSHFPAANACKNYTPAAPATSSGWFLPSHGQLMGIYNTYVAPMLADISINMIIAGGDDFANGYNWSSSEVGGGDHKAYAFMILWNNSSMSYKNDLYTAVRPVLAF